MNQGSHNPSSGGEEKDSITEHLGPRWEQNGTSESSQVNTWSGLYQGGPRSGRLLSAWISFPQTITRWVPLALLFTENRKQLSLESQRKHTFSHFLKDWLRNFLSLQIHKIWCPNKIVLFFQEILKYFKNHRCVFLADIWQDQAVSWQNARGENKTVCRAHLHPRGLPKETRGERVLRIVATCPHTGIQKKRVGGASKLSPQKTGLLWPQGDRVHSRTPRIRKT